jgi:hypothetical protein
LLRAGYETSYQDRELASWSGISSGFGFSREALTLDYGFKAMPPLGFHHALTLHYSRKARSGGDKTLLLRSQEKYRQGKYAAALRLCRESVSLNPYNYQARAFCQQIERDLQRLSDRALSLLFTANTLGTLAPQWMDGQAAGGLARRQAKLKELKASYPRSAIVDAGALLSPGMRQDHAAYLYAAYAAMPYHAVNAGPEAARFPEMAGKHSLPWVGVASEIPGITRRRAVRGGANTVVYGFSEARDGNAEAMARELRREMVSWKPKELRVVLLQGRLQTAQELARKIPSLDAIVLSGENGALRQPIQVGRVLIVCPGARGTALGQLTWVLERDGKRRSWTHRLIPLDGKVAEDEDMRRLLKPVVSGFDAGLGDAGMDDYRASVLAVLASPPGRPDSSELLLADLATGRLYPVPHPGLRASAPVLGYGQNKVAFAGRDSMGKTEFYLAQPGKAGLDTLTRWGGLALKARFALKGRALIATYRRSGTTRLVRIDPWNRSAQELSDSRFGNVHDFSLALSQDRVAFTGGQAGAESLWIAGLDLSSALALSGAAGFVGAPAWSPDGKKVAALERSQPDDAEGNLALFDLEGKGRIPLPIEVRARRVAFSADGKSLLLSAGVNLLDMQELALDSMSLRTLPGPSQAPRGRERPRPKLWNGRDGVLFESAQAAPPGRRSLRFLDRATGRETAVLEGDRDYSLE